MTLLIEDFEERHYQLPRAKPLEVLQFLMDQHDLLQKDLADVFGTPSIVSEVLSGKVGLRREKSLFSSRSSCRASACAEMRPQPSPAAFFKRLRSWARQRLARHTTQAVG